ncbi:MAG: ribosome silencing factor [Candidatus Omnitrophica bacterium]|nr:ribosome silencing factor [Candidatus Omnitrophota bacterium]
MQVKRTIKKKAVQTSLQIAKTAAKFAADKKAEDITVMDMRGVVNFCDFFVIASGTSTRHAQAIAEGVVDDFKDLGTRISRKEGMQQGVWVLVDLGSVVVHVFEKETREFYGLDHLWQDAKKVVWKR